MLVYNAAFYGSPEIFWLQGNSYSYSYIMEKGQAYVYSVMPNYWNELKVSNYASKLESYKKEFNEAANSLLACVSSDMTDYEKELALHDALCFKVTYSKSGSGIYNGEHTAYGSIVKGYSVCDGYVKGMSYLLSQVGVQSYEIVGYGLNESTGSPEAHAWNIVRLLNGNTYEYYYLDATWNDHTVANTGNFGLYHSFFNLSKDAISADHIIQDDDIFPELYKNIPDADVDNLFYFTVNSNSKIGSAVTTSTMNTSSMVNQMKYKGYSTWYFKDTLVANISTIVKSWLSNNIITVADELGMVSGNLSYSYTSSSHELHVMIKDYVPPVISTFTLSGTIKSLNSGDNNISIELYENEGDETPVYSKNFQGSGNTSFTIKDIEKGQYYVLISKTDHWSIGGTISITEDSKLPDITLYHFADITESGIVTSDDTATLSEYLADPDNISATGKTAYNADYDVNRDGSVDALDLVLICKFVAGYDVSFVS